LPRQRCILLRKVNDTRSKAALNQVVCTLEGMCTLLQQTPGDFAVVVHGDRDCSNVLFYGMDHPGTERFFCSNLTEEDAIAGRSAARLEACLAAVYEEFRPATIFVLGTCLSILIGEDMQATVKRFSENHDQRIVTLPGTGMQFVTQSQIMDGFAGLMLGSCERSKEQDKAINLIGFDPGKQVVGQLRSAGIEINSVIGLPSPVESWNTLGRARTNVVIDKFLFSSFLSEASRKLKQNSLEVPWPVGYGATCEFFECLLQEFVPAMDGYEHSAESARQVLRESRTRMKGLRLGYNIGSKKNLDPVTLAREGLCDLPAFEELGFEIVILVQGDDRPQRLSAVRQTLDELGCDHPMEIFSDTVFFGELCSRLECDLVYASDHLADQALSAKTAFLEYGSLEPGFTAVKSNIESILAALDGPGGGGK